MLKSDDIFASERFQREICGSQREDGGKVYFLISHTIMKQPDGFKMDTQNMHEVQYETPENMKITGLFYPIF